METYSMKHQKYYGIALEVSKYLRARDYVTDIFKGAVYTYNRTENPNLELPAIFIYYDRISPNGMTGSYSTGTLRVEIVRNTATQNRGDIFDFTAGIGELIFNDLVVNKVFRHKLLTKFPYIGMFGERSQIDFVEGRNSTVISIAVYTSQVEYQRYLRSIPYNTTNATEVETIKIKELKIT